ncbi:MAG: hypothetical protein IVW54_14270 [Candidatus Binataceae bacterium]|nr:hypothetical protein [Candidatus Binataceae bacterium]
MYGLGENTAKTSYGCGDRLRTRILVTTLVIFTIALTVPRIRGPHQVTGVQLSTAGSHQLVSRRDLNLIPLLRAPIKWAPTALWNRLIECELPFRDLSGRAGGFLVRAPPYCA